MVTPALRINARRVDRLPTRTVRLTIDGASADVSMTRSEERALRRRLQPFLDTARRIGAADNFANDEQAPVRLSVQLREARVAALLGLPSRLAANATSGAGDLDALVERAAAIYSNSLAEETRATYRRRFLVFSSWCEKTGLTALPAESSTLMLFVADLVSRNPQPSLSTVRGYVNAVNRIHRELDMGAPADDAAVGLMMRGLSHVIGTPRANPMSAHRVEELRAVCRHLDHPDAVVVRDAAVLRLVLAGVPAAVVARLRWSDVRFNRQGMLLGERPAKNAAVATWREVAAHSDPLRCPVHALQRWRSIAGTRPDVVFTITDRAGRRDSKTLGPSGIRRILDSRSDSLGPQRGAERLDLAGVADLLHETATDVLRDRALLLLGFAIAARRNELTGLRWGDITDVDEGLVIRIRRSKTDLDGRGTTVGVPHGRSALTDPVRAIQAWRDRVRHQLQGEFSNDTPVFMKIGRTGRITADQPLTDEGLTMVVKRRAEAAGLAGHWGGRSLRAGLISSCADLDLPLELIAQQSRHASLDSLVRYVRVEDVFRRNALDRLSM